MAGITVIPPRNDLTDPNTASDVNDLMQNFQNDQFYIDEITGNIGINRPSNIGTLISMTVGGKLIHIDGAGSIGNLILEGDLGGRILLADTDATADSRIVGLLQSGTSTYLRQYNDDGTIKLNATVVDQDGKISTGGETVADVVAGGIHIEMDGTVGDAIVIKDGTTEYAAITNLGAASFDGGVDAGASGTVLKTKVIEIGDWDMDTDAFASVTHGLSDEQMIRSIDVMIRNDLGNNIYKLEHTVSGVIDGGVATVSTGVSLNRTTGGFFDSVNFSTTSYNRGWVYIVYEA